MVKTLTVVAGPWKLLYFSYHPVYQPMTHVAQCMWGKWGVSTPDGSELSEIIVVVEVVRQLPLALDGLYYLPISCDM